MLKNLKNRVIAVTDPPSEIGKDERVHHDQIIQMISADETIAPKIYKQCVENGMGVDLENPFLKIYGGSIRGEILFIKQALHTLKEGALGRRETSHREMLESAFEFDVMVHAVSNYFGIDKEVALNDKKEYRTL